VEIGVVQMPTDPWPATIERALELEAMGFDHVWLYDHLSWRHYRDRPWHATIPWLAALAASTTTIRLGTMVVSPTLRHPLLLAKEVMSLDHVSGGRFVLGLGAGGTGFDASAYGEAPLSPAERADRFDEYARVVDGLLRGELTDHRGRWYTVDGGRMLPGCLQRPRVPLALAASRRRSMPLVARLADTWITIGDRSRPPETIEEHVAALATQSAWLDEACGAIGRDPAEVGRTVLLPSSFGLPLTGIDRFASWAEAVADLGFGTIVVHDHRSDDPALDVGADTIEAIARWRHTG
jgi:alkanesulfonate monooxygenase SsuD/methylene tetrahydromethanopterin reductase-like flavin-dependent oxidoreductase (luciferase family)